MDFPTQKAYKKAPKSTAKTSYSQTFKPQNPALHCLKLLVLLLLLMADPKRTTTTTPRKKKPTTKKNSLIPVLEEGVDTQVISGQNFISPRHTGPLVIREPDVNRVGQSKEGHYYGKGKQKFFPEEGSQIRGGILNSNPMFNMIDINAPLVVNRGEASSSRQPPAGSSPAFRSSTQKSPVSEMINQTVQLKITEPSLILHVKAETHPGGKRWMLALKVISKKIFSITTVKSDIQDNWQLKGEFAMAKYDLNMFSLCLTTQEDYDMVLEERPWCIHSQLVNVKEWPSDIPMSGVDFTTSPFWIQVKGLPPNQINEENGILIAGLFHSFLELDMDPFAPLWRQQFLRIRAEVSVINPFLAGFNNVVADGKKVWIKFRYEKLPDICFYCGKIGHNKNFCDTKSNEERDGIIFVGKYRYGLFMRSSHMLRARDLAQVIEAKRQFQEMQKEVANNAGVFNTAMIGNHLEPFTDQEFVNTDLYINADYFNNVTDFQIPPDPQVSNFLQASFSELTNLAPTDIPPMIHPETTATYITNGMATPPTMINQANQQNMRVPKGILNHLSLLVQKKIIGVTDPRDIPMENQVELVVDFYYGKQGPEQLGQIVTDKDMDEIRALLAEINPTEFPLPTSVKDFQSTKEKACAKQISKAVVARTWKKIQRNHAIKGSAAPPTLQVIPPKSRGKRKLGTAEFPHQYEDNGFKMAMLSQTPWNELQNSLPSGKEPNVNPKLEEGRGQTEKKNAKGEEANLEGPPGRK